MKKWILVTFIVVVILLSWRITSLYQSTMNYKLDEQEKALLKVKEEELLKTVNEVSTYYGTAAYHVVIGDTHSGEKKIIWVPEDAKKDTIIRKQDEGVTKEKALSKLYNNPDLDPKEIRSIKLGVEWDSKTSKDRPIWEIIYLDQNDRITYYRSFFSTGDYWKIIKP
ncbi:cell wall elongation regulator TseB-like domain-containing protein [Litchfieldia salsa]|uniref:Uncharacterized protein YpmB n=1 Tax=Litchfieldia salsa TaxID=930152 RepID=A0A1H0TKK6_9BACI|nr:DUF5590 domain-containing protein [Litchfieldia salsa]SDP54381.1 Uncharacterized protein YpmB [Litchfieldia salsa]